MPASVLVVDDDVVAREALGCLLASEGYDVIAVSDGQEALDVLRGDDHVRLVLLDLMMPTMDGWTFMAERARDPALVTVPVVVVSAVGQQAAHLDAVACVRKPVDPDALMELVQRYCAD
jgi:CheY-like chemotaxis protein